MIHFQTLENTPFEQIVACMLEGFKDYFVPMPQSISYWQNRYQAARVNWHLSAGAFDDDQLIALIINGVDQFDGVLTAFNTGTCVIESYRGKALVDQLYHFLFDKLSANQIETCLLEVIQENHRAIHVYERIGFEIVGNYHCFKGSIPDELSGASEMLETKFATSIVPPRHNSWDNSSAGIALNTNTIKHFDFLKGNQVIGSLSIDPNQGNIFQIEKANEVEWEDIFYHFKGQTVKYNNVPEERDDLIDALESYGLEKPAMQYLMKKNIS